MVAVILLSALVLVIAEHSEASNERAVVTVSQGRLEGERVETVTGDATYFSFKGIPYALPPIGTLRFKAPLPPLPWDGIRNATKHGSICPQTYKYTNEFVRQSDEDCLFLNVYTPNIKTRKKLPVVFIIHGEEFKRGSGNDDIYGPDFIVERNVVVVTINYRLGVLGFLCMNTDEVPGNAAMKDQVMALRWVKENINNFGGNPNDITIMGESVGGVSVSLHLMSPMTKGLFKRAIALSGTPFRETAIPVEPAARPYVIGKQLGLATNDTEKLLEFLQNASVEKLVTNYPFITSSEVMAENIKYRAYHHTPVIELVGENKYLGTTVYKSLKLRNVHEADVFYGHTSKPSLFILKPILESYLQKYDRFPELLVQKKMFNFLSLDENIRAAQKVRDHYFGNKTINEDVLKEFISFMDDINYVYDVHTFFDIYPQIGSSRKYFYQFSLLSDRNVYGKVGEKYGIYGAAHTDDLYYLFQAKAYNMTVNKNSREYRLVQLAVSIFVNFVKYGNPTPDASLGVKWPLYNSFTKRYVDINDTLTVHSRSDVATTEFWDEVYDGNKQKIYMRY